MPYFFIIPAYIVILLGLIIASIVTRCVPRFRVVSGYIVGGMIGTLIGFIIINIIVVLAGVAPAWLYQKFTFPNWLHQVSNLFVAATLLIGPFIGTAIGVMFGFVGGLYFVYNRRKKAV